MVDRIIFSKKEFKRKNFFPRWPNKDICLHRETTKPKPQNVEF